MLWRFSLLAILFAFQVSPAMAGQHACALSGERPMGVVQLYFGRSIAGRGPVTDAEWAAFAANVLSRDFPDGFTAYDGDGQWLDPSTGEIVREQTKIVTIAVREDGSLAKRINAVSDAYKKQFRQKSVGVTTERACGAF